MYTNIERELDWEDSIAKEGSGWVLLEEGEYPFTIKEIKRERHGGSAKLPPCNKIKASITIHDFGRETTIDHNLFLHSKTEGLLCAFFTSIGMKRHGEPLRMNWNIIGKQGYCKVGVRDYTTNTGEERQSNQIEYFLEPKEDGQVLTSPKQQSFSGTQSSWQQGSY